MLCRDKITVAEPEALRRLMKGKTELSGIVAELRSLLASQAFEKSVHTQPFYGQDFEQ